MAIINGTLDENEKITVETVCSFLDWKNFYKNNFWVSKELYLKNESHFKNEFTSLFLLKNKVYISI